MLRELISTVRAAMPIEYTGSVVSVKGLTLTVRDMPVPVGALVRVGERSDAGVGEVVGFDDGRAIVMLLSSAVGVRPGEPATGLTSVRSVHVGRSMLGRCIDALGRPIDGLGPLYGLRPAPLDPEPSSPLRRRPIRQAMHTGIRSIDLMATLGRGQRMGIFAGPGVGKSTLLGTIARNCESEVNVIALIGERGREVRDFIEHSLGVEGLARSVVVAATGDESPLMRVRAALTASAIAEHFRDRGGPDGGPCDVMLMMDSVTRFAHAQRQIGLAVGEPPATRGYTPSVFATLSRLLERAGSMEGSGSITGLYTILVEGDDMTEPVSDAARGILDGHIILARSLAQRGHFPAVDVLDSVSRVAGEVCDKDHIAARQQAVRLLSAYARSEDLIQIGAYAKGSSAETDTAIAFRDRIVELLRQGASETEPFAAARQRLLKIAADSSLAPAGAQGRSR